MMTKEEAHRWIKEIQNGEGVDRHKYLDRIGRGEVAVKYWDDPSFALGVEYGVIIALTEIFGFQKGDF